jgi:zinc transporter 1/2/3
MSDDADCTNGGGATSFTGLRIASVFIIWIASTFGALFPVIARRTKIQVPPAVFEFAKYFGSGVIIATAFIHLLDPATDELTSPCLSDAWQGYPYALAIALVSIFALFIVELFAFRFGTRRLERIGIKGYDAHNHNIGGGHAAHGPEDHSDIHESDKEAPIDSVSINSLHKDGVRFSTSAQVLGVAILEFGVVLHSVLIGLTLAVDPDFKILFVVIVFHQMFEGLGLGARLAFIDLPTHRTSIPVGAALLYGITTPIGIAAGLGVRTSYNPGTARASIVSGVLDATSAGILIYTGLVELMAHEFLFSEEMKKASDRKVVYAVVCMMCGCGLMALLGKWA